MLSTDQTSAPPAERKKKPRPRRLGRALAIAGMAFALLGGTIETASATVPAEVFCPHDCWQEQNIPAGVNWGQWQDANSAAAFWANYNFQWGYYEYTPNGTAYDRISWHRYQGWPAQVYGGRWVGYWEGSRQQSRFMYYGGLYNDYGRQVSNEERRRGVGAADAYSTFTDNWGRHNAPYVEYDMDAYTSPTGRNDRRLVRNPRTGHVYVTFDHYNTFHYLGRF
ncbi:ribonuclease domain-containing protein [Streptomyces sp. NPDC005474]|uniref:ribonuclease domain-containing protein n=1 Tax=Streptomyces sp. NPDC005474 TaxID=3154878 RepID=UPI003454379C